MRLATVLIVVTLMALVASMAAAHDGSSHAAPGKSLAGVNPRADASSVERKAREYFTDLPVVTRDGRTLRFFSDVLKDRVVLISLFYTNCESACPLTADKLAKVQEQLGDDLGRNIFLISLSLDPARDTLQAVKKFAEKFQPKDGWLFLTGDVDHVTTITRRLGQTGDQVEAHPVYFMIGNVKIARWAKIPPHLPAEFIAARLREMASFTTAN